jgi:TPR repeat protein
VFLILMLSGVPVFQLQAQETQTARRMVEEVKAKAEAGDADSELWLGAYYERGVGGLPQDNVEALKWYRKTAEQNNALGQYCVGLSYANGSGVPKDYAEAVKWFRKAAEQNDAQAQASLGLGYANGRGVAKDEVEAVKWYRKAAEQNDAQGQLNLGACYVLGQGVAKDEVGP